MGQGGFINITNATPYEARLLSISSYQMKSWKGHWPNIIAPGQSTKFYIEFSEGFLETITDDNASVTYELQKGGRK